MKDVNGFRRAVLGWAQTVERPLPWRGERDPYRVLVSEVMLQQTQASRVASAYVAFLERYPTVRDLAAASRADVLRAWAGLGYNRRAVHLHEAARAIVRDGFPQTVDGLLALPGVGGYTARAVVSFAFGVDTAAVDANVRRIFTRTHGLPEAADVQPIADRLLPPGRAAEWNQALMDLGALVCRPRGPRCDTCPLRRRCSYQAGDRPARSRRRPSRPFPQTNRYARGRVVAVLRQQAGLTGDALVKRTGLAPDRVSHALDTLERDGIVSRARTGWTLG